jgi:hypothetical protein
MKVKELLVAPGTDVPFFDHCQVKGPVPEVTVLTVTESPAQPLWASGAVVAVLVFAVRFAQRWTGVPQAPETVTQ